MLRGLVNPEKLTAEQEGHIDSLQAEIDEIWNRRGDYKLNPDAWEDMPIFMETVTEADVERNAQCAALSQLVYDEVPPDEIAENRKEHGNRALKMALNPAQENRSNLARAACHAYTEGLQAKGKDTALSSTIYANRSLAQFIIGNYGHGLEDAQRAVILNPDYHKAYYRGAKCAEKLRKYDMAIDFLKRGRQLNIDANTQQEFDELEKICTEARDKLQEKETKVSRTQRVEAAKLSNIARAITSQGIKLGAVSEVTSEQMGVYGNPSPYFGTDKMLHVPILMMYDEYQQSDMLHDVSCDACVLDLLEELMPFPWDVNGRYARPDDIVVFYKIDDGVNMPKHYEVNKEWPLMEIFRGETYMMPRLQPVLHMISKQSEYLDRFEVKRL